MKITLYTPDGEPITYDNTEIQVEDFGRYLKFVGTPLWILDSPPVTVKTTLPYLIHYAVTAAEVFASSPLVQDNIPKGPQ